MTVDPSDGLTQYSGPTLAQGVQAAAGRLGTAYVPGQQYAPSPVANSYGAGNVTVSTAPTTGYYPVAGESLWVGKDQEMDPRSFPGRPGYAPSSVEQNVKKYVSFTLGGIDEALSEILTADEAALKAYQKQLGVKATGLPDAETLAAAGTFLDYASTVNAAGVQKTWQQLLKAKGEDGSPSWLGASGTGAEEPFTGTKTTTSSQVRTLSPSETRAMAEQAFVAAIGREPTRQERKALRAKLNEMARDNPEVTTTTHNIVEGVETDTDSITNGGVDFGQKILNEARSTEGFGEFQAATTYWDEFVTTLAAPVAGG